MNSLSKSHTTVEQGLKLIKLGLPLNSCDMFYSYSQFKKKDLGPYIVNDCDEYTSGIPNGYETYFTPCWSAGRLIEIFELCSGSEFKRIKSIGTILDDILFQIENQIVNSVDGLQLDFSELKEICS